MSVNPYIILYPTTRCDVGCSHCLHGAQKNGLDMPFDYFPLLVKKLEAEKIKANVCATGYGEPLLYGQFKEMHELLLGSPVISYLSLITAGYTRDETAKREKLLNLLHTNTSDKLTFVHSFNVYGDFERRLASLLEDTIQMPTEQYINVKICVSRENAKETVRKFNLLLIALAMANDLKDCTYCGIDERLSWLINEDFLKSRKYFLHGHFASHKIRTMYHTFSAIGRACESTDTAWYRQKCCCLDHDAHTEIVLFPDGYFYPCDRSIGSAKRRLGHIKEDSIGSILEKKKKLVSFAKKAILPIEKIFDKTPCAICRQLP